MASSSDENHVNKKKQEAQLERETSLEALRLFIEHPGGRKWVWDMLVKCHVFNTSMTGNSHTFFKEGERNIGLGILNDLMEADPAAFTSMMKDFNNG